MTEVETSQSEKRSSKSRRRWFRIAAILFPLFVLLLIEFGLRLSGVEATTPLFVYHSSATTLPWQVNTAAETPYFSKHGLAGPEDRRFELPAQKNTFRIVVLGASTVQGFPYESAIAFPRQLEFLLNVQLDAAGDERRVEVLNLGVTAINSFSLVDMAERCLQCEPDLVVIYAGHNEFYGPGGAASTASHLPQSLYPLGLFARRTAMFKAWSAWKSSRSKPDIDSPIDSLPETLQIPFEGPLFQSAEQHYEANLQRIVDVFECADVPLTLCTVIGNLKDHSPTSYLLPEDEETVDPGWRTLFDQGRAAASAGEYDIALQKLKAAGELYDRSSLLFYRMGKCLFHLGRMQESVAAYSRARDLDGSRFRAPSSFAKIVTRIAAASSNTTVVDLVQQLRQKPDPLPGQKFFLEHVHPNLEGHRFIASSIGETVLKQHLKVTADWQVPSVETWEQSLGILPVDRLAGLSLTFDVLNSETMSQSFDNQRQLASLAGLIKNEYQQLPESYRGPFPELSISEMSTGLLDHLRREVDSKNVDLHREILEAAVKRSPWSPDYRDQLVGLLSSPEDQVQRNVHEAAAKALKLSRVR